MLDYSVQGYLQRLGSEELEAFLQQCMLLQKWYDYDHIVPLIFTILESRSHTVAQPILDSWETYLRDQQRTDYIAL